jgi:succinate dehydrogenase/fumarate reductase flavoprotein subunit
MEERPRKLTGRRFCPSCRRLLLQRRHPDRSRQEDRHEVSAGADAPDNLEQTVARYNSFVDSGTDDDFGKPKPLHKIATPPFHAAWATPVIHDTRAGLRINANCQVIDMNGQVIPGLYCGGESAGGFSLHGLARATCQGYIAGHHAVLA